ncbi:rhomboid family intramembrane serine protease GlpG [Moellerella wisconsensis]|uniref:rhomboid family intramembrane serine protease GlpG n=1 Tax=Moellerella wisconsensis TaxID=158849 RepID=UPI003075F65A
MIHVISLDNPRIAQAFVDYMATQNIQLEMRPANNNHQVELWLLDNQHIDQVQQQLTEFLHNPLDARYQAASWQTGDTNNHFQYPNYLTFGYLKSQSGPLTIGVLGLCIVVYLWMQITSNHNVMSYLAWPMEHQKAELWRWFTPAFLHFSISHIAFNLALWWYLAGQVERQLGFGKLLTITLVAALFSNWGQSVFSGPNFGGLSGVVYALISYVWLMGERQPERGLGIPRGLMAFSILWLFFGYFDILGMHIANAAHTSGLIIGLLMGVWDNRHTFSSKHSQ